jgi:hypothetical protein
MACDLENYMQTTVGARVAAGDYLELSVGMHNNHACDSTTFQGTVSLYNRAICGDGVKDVDEFCDDGHCVSPSSILAADMLTLRVCGVC